VKYGGWGYHQHQGQAQLPRAGEEGDASCWAFYIMFFLADAITAGSSYTE
jgi:hypothetical protein